MSERAGVFVIRPAEGRDLSPAVALNEVDVDRLSPLTIGSLDRLRSFASYFRVAEEDGRMLGFLLALTPEAPYDSPNFAWFRSRYVAFVYVDRIVIAGDARRSGVASALYRDLETVAAAAGATRLACEINVHPPNPESLAFHDRHGFFEVGTRETDDRAKKVSLRIKELASTRHGH